jgi:hypothetical protein
MPKVDSAQLARLDPTVPYIIVLPTSTPQNAVTNLVAFLGKLNVMATILVGEPKDFKIFASIPWVVSATKPLPDIHPLVLLHEAAEGYEADVAKVLNKNFVSALHDDAEAVQVLYGRVKAFGITDSQVQTTVDAMVRCSILKFQVFNDLNHLAATYGYVVQKPALPAGNFDPETGKPSPAPSVDKYDTLVAQLSQELTGYLNEDLKGNAGVQDRVLELSQKIAKNGLTPEVETSVLKLQNENVLMSGVMTLLRGMDLPKPKVKTKRAAGTATKKRTTKSK